MDNTKIINESEFLEKYGNVVVEFIRYYKYTFTFYGVILGETVDTIEVYVGGSPDDIYKLDVSVNNPIEIKNLGRIYGFKFTKADGSSKLYTIYEDDWG